METIAAISTAMGNGGIGIIRMSGKETFNILQKMFVNNKKEKLNIDEIKGYTMQYGFVINSSNGEIIDGAPVTTHYVFKGLKEGETTITFKSVSVENGSITWEEKKYIKVDKENNISIIKNKS